MDKLDLKDRKILFELDLNARQSDSEIAKKVGLTRDSVRYRINKLVENGYINYFMTLLNSMKLGYNWYRTFFKFQNLTIEKEKEIIEYLKQRASWISKVEGIWDLNTGIFVKNVYEYRDLINEFLLKYSSFIERYDVSIVTREWSYHRDYLLNKKQKTSKPLLMGFDPQKDYKTETIDKTDYKILKTILKNARMKTIDIAREIKTTEMVVRYRLKKLIQNGIIIGFKPFLNVHKLGYIYFKLHLSLQNLTPEKKKSIVNYIHQHPNTVHMTELVGGADLETEFQVKTNEEFYTHVQNLRLKFGDIIRDYEFMQYTQEYKFTYLPEMF
ncbi:MAG: Lrp/AsnC family transcriptional regulator [Nanoarchaeota archaeon]|nr:Lrp/AsnC family transcriptional regulator [Nanoarchaeota archaeon]MBU1976515.1 Lrp/AsnC family transcriptional regulator [Nanoarchaeota archaeon]